MRSALLALSILLAAPYQCGTEPNDRPRQDSAPKALWTLAERFERENNGPARETTLKQLLELYPTSRYAERAREALGIASPAGEKGSDEDWEEEKKSEE